MVKYLSKNEGEEEELSELKKKSSFEIADIIYMIFQGRKSSFLLKKKKETAPWRFVFEENLGEKCSNSLWEKFLYFFFFFGFSICKI